MMTGSPSGSIADRLDRQDELAKNDHNDADRDQFRKVHVVSETLVSVARRNQRRARSIGPSTSRSAPRRSRGLKARRSSG
jgi:hypothetical protein